jgi:predicted dehydrogenase
MRMAKQNCRRRFLNVGTAIAAPFVVRPAALGLAGAVPPSDRITLGLIGCGLHGTGWNLDQVICCPDAQVVAVCDVDDACCQKAKAKVDEHYGRRSSKNYRGCAVYHDFREQIRCRQIDDIINTTPDHWHVIPSTMAALAGKDVICEKPLTLIVAEGRRLCESIARTGRIFQAASENRSIDSDIRLCELVRNGRIGALRHIIVSLPAGIESRGDNFTRQEVEPIPKDFNYEMWLGQAPLAPYCPARCHGSFRWNLDYSGGRLTDWGTHLIDLAQWGNDSEMSGPVEVEGTGKFPPRSRLFNTATEFDLHYRYANGVTLNVVSRGPGIRFEGTDGWIECVGWRAPLRASSPAIVDSPIGPDDVRLYRPSEIVKNTDGGRGGEYRNFLDGVKSRQPCYAPAETGHRTITTAHIGNIAMQLGRKLEWDPAAERFVGDAQADKMLRRHQGEPWTIENIAVWLWNSG